MPIRRFLKNAHRFDGETVRVMGLAFECARASLNISTDDARSEIVAARIIELATTGERDSEKLCDYAIEGLRTTTEASRNVPVTEIDDSAP